MVSRALEVHPTLGSIGGQILWRVEERNVMSENFVGFVAFDRLGARVPAFDPTRGVQHENGVVPDAAHHEPGALFASAECLQSGRTVWRRPDGLGGRLHHSAPGLRVPFWMRPANTRVRRN